METNVSLLPTTSLAQPSDIQKFVQCVARADTVYSTEITIPYNDSGHLEVTLKRRNMREVEDGVGLNSSELCPSLGYSFEGKGALLPVIRTLAACSTWTHGRFIFHNSYDFNPDLDEVMLELFSLLRSCRSLSTLDLQFQGFHHIHLPTLLCENPFLKKLILYVYRDLYVQKYVESIAEYLSQKSVLKSFTLVLDDTPDYRIHIMETLLRPFMSSSENETNVVLKELDIRSQSCKFRSCPDVEAIVNLVRCNTTLKKLELRWLYNSGDVGCKLIAGALEVNHTLKEFHFRCSVPEMKELVRVLVPDQSGHQPNTSLSTLKLFSTGACFWEDFMDELARMVKSNTTLKHVQVSGVWSSTRWQKLNLGKTNQSARYVECKTLDRLELMVHKELKLNSSLQSLVVGHWKLLRVGPEWHMTYQGPCFSTSTVKEYLVKVKTHR